MKIIGWIRQGDKAACGGLVAEGDPFCTGRGKPYAFQGAKMACEKTCSITQGFVRRTLTNGCAEGLPYYIETMDGRVFSGRIGPDGLLPRVDTCGEDEYTVLWGDDALAKLIDESANG